MKRSLFALLGAVLWATQSIAGCTLGALPFTLQNNTLADATQVMANFDQIVNAGAINCAQSGVNNDITALDALSTPITPAQGGTNVFNGSGVTSGSPNAQTLTVSGPFSLTAGVSVIGVVGTGLSNTAPTTLQVNGGAITSVLRNSQVGAANTAGGELVAGNQFMVTYTGSSWIIQGRVDLIGEIRMYGSSPVPNGWIIADGSTMSCSGNTAVLCGVLGTTYGCTGCLPDTRGRNLTGFDNYGTSIGAAGRLTSSATGCGITFNFLGASCTNGGQSHTQIPAELAAHTHGVNDPGHSHTISVGTVAGGTPSISASFTTASTTSTGTSTTGITIQSQGSSQPMPIVNPNFGMYFVMKL